MKGACALSCGHCKQPRPLTVREDARLGRERAVITTSYGEIVLGFFPKVAPVTVAHIVRLFRMGGYNTMLEVLQARAREGARLARHDEQDSPYLFEQQLARKQSPTATSLLNVNIPMTDRFL